MNPSCILVVEPDILVRSPLSEYLRECGYTVLEASSAAEARRLLAERAQDIGAALIDVEASGSGFELASWIRAHNAAIEVIMAGTVEKQVEKAKDLCEEGPTLSKPYDYQLVASEIRRLLAARARHQRSD